MFKANVVNGGDVAASALLYKQPDITMMDYLRGNMNNILNHATNLSDRFINTVKNMYNKAHDSNVITTSKLLLNSAEYALDQHTLYAVPYDGFNNINLAMQQYVMAYPEINKLNRQNKCYGFQDTYVDPEPDTYGEERYDYQRVMDGVLQHDSEGLAYSKHYSNTDEVKLDNVDRISILDTWHNVARYLAENIDPTDPDLDEL